MPFMKRNACWGNVKIVGSKRFKNYPFELTSKRFMTWHKISYVVVGKTTEGCDKKVSRVEHYEKKTM
jgi:hypothetical protein